MTQTGLPRPPTHFQDRFRMGYDFPGSGFTAAVAATGLITCVTNANMADSDYLTIGDGLTPAKLYEYDKGADGVTSGRVQWVAGASSAAQCAATLRTAILANQPAFTVTDNLDGTLTLANKWPGLGGNVTITENVANAGFLVSGMSGGLSAVATSITADKTVKLLKVKGRSLQITRVTLNLPAGLAQDASNYCNFKLLKGASTVAANFSTLTGADGTITADTAVEMNISATAVDTVLTDTDVMSLFIDITGSTTVPPGRIVIEGFEL